MNEATQKRPPLTQSFHSGTKRRKGNRMNKRGKRDREERLRNRESGGRERTEKSYILKAGD